MLRVDELEGYMELSDRVALVTGAASGIARATAKLFTRSSAIVVIADGNAGGGMETVEQIRAEGGHANFVEVDVSQLHK
jgi:NAD(P)-dependent dehydrogenase (short-subunit alcohol dehydrogenase family)